MKNHILIIIGLCYIATASAQNAVTVKQLNGKIASTQAIAERITQIIDSGHITGLQVAIINNNQTVWLHSFGVKNTATMQPLNDSTAMYAASLTKTVSAYLFLRLVDKGVFGLDKPVHLYLKKPIAQYPKWKDLADDTASFNKITPRMLLSHTSGMPILRAFYRDKVNLIAKSGQKFYYSNEGMNLLGVMIEEYTGQKLEVLANREIFMPLHMYRTCMIWDSAYAKNYATAYYKDGKIYGSERRSESRAAGSMTTTAGDYAKFVIALQTQYGLSAALFTDMLKPQIAIKTRKGFGPERDSLANTNQNGLSWGLGVGMINTPYGTAYFHAGHGEANQNYYVAYPEKGIAVVLMSNSENFEQSAELILKATIGDSYSPLKWLGYFDN